MHTVYIADTPAEMEIIMVAKQRILIVDDDENIAELISLYLTKECFETKIVYDGELRILLSSVCMPYLSPFC